VLIRIDRQKKHVPYAVAGAGETAFTFASGYAAGVTLTTAVGGGGSSKATGATKRSGLVSEKNRKNGFQLLSNE